MFELVGVCRFLKVSQGLKEICSAKRASVHPFSSWLSTATATRRVAPTGPTMPGQAQPHQMASLPTGLPSAAQHLASDK